MKTILVLTDLTIKADHAAHYALKLAQQIKADLLLCNVYHAEATNKPQYSHASRISDDNQSFKDDSANDLADLARRLNKQLHLTGDDDYKPAIELCSKAGPLTLAINDIVESRHIIMAVIATHSADDFLTFLTGNHANQIIEKAHCPVLVLPYQAPFKGFKKIAFASDLARNGADILHSLHDITQCFDPEVLITHVGVEKLGKVTEEYIVKCFVGEDVPAASYPKVHYKAVQNKNVVAGLDQLAEHADIDLMVLVHYKRNLFRRLFEPSVTKKLAGRCAKPMLVFPERYKRQGSPVF